jgi:hypothetical protein
MDFNSTIDLIIKDLDEARSIIDDLKKYPGVPAFQVELAKAKCKSAGEVISFLKNLQNEVPAVKEAEQNFPEQVRKEIHSKKVSSRPEPDEDHKTSFTKTEVADESIKRPAETTVIGDTFSHLSSSYNEQLGNLKEDEDIREILKSKPLSNLSEAIGVNDKFLFLREIFNNNLDAYSQAITRLDLVNNLTDAKAVIMSYTGDDHENVAIKQLLDLVKRKLHSDE